MSSSTVLAHTFVALRLPSDVHKVLKIIPDTVISLGKYGSFPANLILGRPYFLTFEILDRDSELDSTELRIVRASELHAETIAEDASTPSEVRDDAGNEEGFEEGFEVDRTNGELILRNNRLTVDDPTRQTLTMAEIEELKTETSGSGKEIISRIVQSHMALDEKTAFSLAKYMLRKSKKYMRRFTVLPLDVSMLAHWMLSEKEPARIMDAREETLGLIASWSNVHCARGNPLQLSSDGRWLVVDDTGGLITAALAERMDILRPVEQPEDGNVADDEPTVNGAANNTHSDEKHGAIEVSADGSKDLNEQSSSSPPNPETLRPRRRQKRHPPDAMSATSNTLTLLHSATQPNISILSYFSYSPHETAALDPYPASTHPLHTHLKSVSWLQLLSPHLDGAYAEPEFIAEDVLAGLKTSKRSNYFRKRRRWECTKRVVDEARAGGYDGLVIASTMDVTTILHYVVPLLKGGAQVVVYSPTVEPLAELLDVYSSPRKTAFLSLQRGENGAGPVVPSEDFPLDPRLLLAPSLQTARAKEWQVLPGRTHPLMTGRGGPEGYIFTATRVLPAEGNVEARGNFMKKRKVAGGSSRNGVAADGARESSNVDDQKVES